MMKTLVTTIEPTTAPSSGQIDPNEANKMIKSATGSHISPLPSTTASVFQQPGETNFPRGSRNRQTFHGKTEHTKGSGQMDGENDSETEEANALTIGGAGGGGGANQTMAGGGGGAGQRGSFLSKLTKLTKRFGQ